MNDFSICVANEDEARAVYKAGVLRAVGREHDIEEDIWWNFPTTMFIVHKGDELAHIGFITPRGMRSTIFQPACC